MADELIVQQLLDQKEKIIEMDKKIDVHFEFLAKKLQEHDEILHQHGEKLDQHGVKLDQHGVKLDQHGVKLDQMVTKDEFRNFQDQAMTILKRLDEDRLAIVNMVKRHEDMLEEQKNQIQEHEEFIQSAKVKLNIP